MGTAKKWVQLNPDLGFLHNVGTDRDVYQIFLAALYKTSHLTLLPELFSALGEDLCLELMRIAGGETIEIPTIDVFVKAVKSVHIHQYLTKHGYTSTNVHTLAQEHRMTTEQVKSIYTDMKRFAKRLETIRKSGYRKGNRKAKAKEQAGS
jgi:hypothetical protein